MWQRWQQRRDDHHKKATAAAAAAATAAATATVAFYRAKQPNSQAATMKGRHFCRRFSLQPSFMRSDNDDEKIKRDKNCPGSGDEDAINVKGKRHKIVVMGAAKVGKTAIITQFLYNTFNTKYKRTIEEMHQGNFNVHGSKLTLDVLDTAGSYEFPAMRALSISSAEAFILVYDVTSTDTFEEVRRLRDQILEARAPTVVPIVVVGNKTDLVELEAGRREVEYATTESIVTLDWENGFVEASAAQDKNITQVFKELLAQAKIAYNLSPAMRRRRRQSLPHQTASNGAQTPTHIPQASGTQEPTPDQLEHLQRIQDQSLGGKRNSCIIS